MTAHKVDKAGTGYGGRFYSSGGRCFTIEGPERSVIANHFVPWMPPFVGSADKGKCVGKSFVYYYRHLKYRIPLILLNCSVLAGKIDRSFSPKCG
jgi:hypothetical protein